MNDRLRIASEQLAAAIATPVCCGSFENMAKRALDAADALIAAAGVEGWSQEDARSGWNCRPIEDALRAEVAKYRGMEVEDAALRNDNEALRAEVAALKDENQKMHHDWMADHAEMEHLKDELARYTEPLTDEQAQAVDNLWAIDMGDDYQSRAWDAAIRRVRRGG